LVNDEALGEIVEMYGRMSLLELLAEENMITTYLQTKGGDPVRKRIREILRREIEKRLQ
jgi:hypothetical protein